MTDRSVPPAVWRETVAIPGVLEATLSARSGFDDVLALVRRPATRRLVIAGNGASSYVAHGLWLAALAGAPAPVEVIGVPAGLLASGDLRLGAGDVLLAISASGELRDLVELLSDPPPGLRVAALTGSPASTIARLADATALVAPGPQEAVTHTHAFCGAVAAGLWLLAELSGDDGLRAAVAAAPGTAAAAIADAGCWAETAFEDVASPAAAFAFGSGAAWAAALEAALVIKEICQIPTEGVEAREAATTAMTTLGPDHLVVSLPTAADAVALESERVCASRGARVLRAPGGDRGDRRLAPITTFPAAVALAVELAGRGGIDPDRPGWIDTYYATARGG
jgi:glucosamine--fructose-6-phosphate aminotransferase (isomerizing)